MIKIRFFLKVSFILVFVGLSWSAGYCQTQDSSGLFSKRRKIAKYSASAAYVSTMAGLYSLWYSNNGKSSFHFFNDSKDWNYMDKFGHTTTSYAIGNAGYEIYKWCGYSENKSIWIGGMTGFFFLTSVEVFDGFSSGYGFSLFDISANSLGSGLFIGQQLLWNEQRIKLKFSFHQTEYSQCRPKLLGKSLTENIIKDYNGQTYWLSANIRSFLPKHTAFPGWLNIAVGYGAEGMTGAFENPSLVEGRTIPPFDRKRQFYLSPDIDLTKIKTRSKVLKALFCSFGILKFPLPAIEFSNRGEVVWRAVYF